MVLEVEPHVLGDPLGNLFGFSVVAVGTTLALVSKAAIGKIFEEQTALLNMSIHFLLDVKLLQLRFLLLLFEFELFRDLLDDFSDL